MVKPIPDGFHSITPSLVVSNAREAIDFYKKAFNANEIYTFPTPDGKILHAMIQIADSFVMMADEFPMMGMKSPTTIGGTAVTLHFYVEDADKTFKKAVDAGAVVTMPMMDAFWGDRFGTVMDPFGHSWAIATHKIDMTPEGLRKAGKDYFASLTKK
ncbi:MAG: VOC family protein [Nitrosopumilus sp.]|nr:VOC family protein [Nitrosopumilus sp.]